MSWIIFERLGQRVGMANTGFVIPAFGNDHVVGAVVVGKDGFKGGFRKTDDFG